MISEGPCDRSNGCLFKVQHDKQNIKTYYNIKTVILNCNISQYYCFSVYLFK